MRYLDIQKHTAMRVVTLAALAALSWSAMAQNATSARQEPVETRPTLRQGITQNMAVPLYKSGVLALAEPAARISVGNPDIADILILRSTQLYVLGKDLGSTNVILWDRNDQLISQEVLPYCNL